MTLPEPLADVVVPEAFSPSVLQRSEGCRLRLVLSSTRPYPPRLPTHPAAERGTVFHTLLERAALGAIPRGDDLASAVRSEFDRLFAQAATDLACNPTTAHFVPLEHTLPAVEWHNRRLEVLIRAERLLKHAPPYRPKDTPAEKRAPLRYEELGDAGRWTEVLIHAPGCRLSGRMDTVEKQPTRNVVIQDYKTGRVHDDDGDMLPSLERQLRLYALAVREIDPEAVITLRVSHAKDTTVACDDVILEETKGWLEQQVSGLTAGDRRAAVELATPGTVCRGCPFRHVCPGYRSTAPKLWAEGTEEYPLPLDTWGEVLNIERQGAGTTLTIRDSLGRRVKVFRIDDRHAAVVGAAPGVRLWLFELATPKMTLNRGRWMHPLNFEELPIAGRRRSWTAVIFADAASIPATGV